MFSRIIAGTTRATRKFSTSARKFDADDHMIPMHNMPFKSDNKYKFTLIFALFCSSGLSAPFFIVRHQTLKKNS